MRLNKTYQRQFHYLSDNEHDIQEFCEFWGISEPIAPKLKAPPERIIFTANPIIESKLLPGGIDRISLSKKGVCRSVMRKIRSNSRIKNPFFERPFLLLLVDLRKTGNLKDVVKKISAIIKDGRSQAEKATIKLDLAKLQKNNNMINWEAEGHTVIRSRERFGIDPAQLKRALEAYELHLKSYSIADIAKSMFKKYCRNKRRSNAENGSEVRKQVLGDIKKVKFYIKNAPFIPFAITR